MGAVPFDPALMARFVEAAATSTSRMTSGGMTDWLALRWGVDADGLVVYADHYAEKALVEVDENARLACDVVQIIARGGFVAGFMIALELVSAREAKKS